MEPFFVVHTNAITITVTQADHHDLVFSLSYNICARLHVVSDLSHPIPSLPTWWKKWFAVFFLNYIEETITLENWHDRHTPAWSILSPASSIANFTQFTRLLIIPMHSSTLSSLDIPLLLAMHPCFTSSIYLTARSFAHFDERHPMILPMLQLLIPFVTWVYHRALAVLIRSHWSRLSST
jgi:hypothetical protein